MSPTAMCLFCGRIVPIEDAAEKKHTCRWADSLGPMLPATWRPAALSGEWGDFKQ